MIERRSKTRRRLEAAGFALLAVALALGLYLLKPPFLERLDATARDLIFQLRDSPEPNPAVLVVAVDEKAVKTHGRWPWPRETQAQLIGRLDQLGAAVIALDIVYVVPDDPEQDATLASTFANSEAPIIGGYFFRDKQSLPPSEAALAEHHKNRIKVLRQLPGARPEEITSFPYVEVSLASISRHYAAMGFFNAIDDRDGIVRHAPLVLRYDGKLFPSLATAALSVATGSPPALTIGSNGVDLLQLAGLPIPIDEVGELALNFYKSERDVEEFSAADILDGTVTTAQVAGRVVFLGVTEVGQSDVVPTPLEQSYPGIRIHATAASNILSQQFLHTSEAQTLAPTVAMIAGLPMLLVLLLVLSPKLHWMLLAALSVLGLTVLIFYQLVTSQGLLVSVIYPMLGLLIGFLVFQAYYVITAEFTTGFLRKAFASYVSPALVQQLIENPDQLSLGGQTREITILFSDIRSFTTISESMQPTELVEMLNEYLGEMTDIVMARNGTLDKYIGDAVMAFFNAPLDVPDHPAKAADTALAMQAALPELNTRFGERFDQSLAIGIGLHTGEAVVGNIGAEKRFDYTAIGDTINLGARLESGTKQYGVSILISEPTRKALDDSDFVCRHIDRIQVKGKTEAVDIYQLMARGEDQKARSLADAYEQALEQYFAADFDAAAKRFEKLILTHKDKTSEIFATRCREFIAHPPADGWNGVYVATSK